jgi:hypothetical protein
MTTITTRGTSDLAAGRPNRTPVLLSVNVGKPRDVSWHGKTVHTGVWKHRVAGPRMVRRLNIDGDGQGDTNGHGGEQRAVLVYQIASYRHWQRHFRRDHFSYGQFGENLTVDGLPDDEVCIGDRCRIGEAEFEVTHHALLTHQGKYEARIAGAAIAARGGGQPVDSSPWGSHAVTADYKAVPQVFFCDPPAGAVGLTADQAERAGHRMRVIDVDPAPRSSGPACTPTATPAALAWSSTRTTVTCSVPPSSAPAWKNCSTRPPSPWRDRCPWPGCGTPSLLSVHQRGLAAAAGMADPQGLAAASETVQSALFNSRTTRDRYLVERKCGVNGNWRRTR